VTTFVLAKINYKIFYRKHWQLMLRELRSPALLEFLLVFRDGFQTLCVQQRRATAGKCW